MSSSLQLALRDYLRYHERKEHRQAKTGELEWTESVRKRMLHYRRKNVCHDFFSGGCQAGKWHRSERVQI